MSNKRYDFKHHYGNNDCNGSRIEWFTNLGPAHYNKRYLTLKTGKFRVTRKDNDKGVRFFINDSRDAATDPNCVILFDQDHMDIMTRHEIKPAYTRDDLNVYFFGEYAHPNLKAKLIISADGIREVDVAV